MKIKIADQILYENEDIILMVFILSIHSQDAIDIALDEYFDAKNAEATLYESYRVNNKLYLLYATT